MSSEEKEKKDEKSSQVEDLPDLSPSLNLQDDGENDKAAPSTSTEPVSGEEELPCLLDSEYFFSQGFTCFSSEKYAEAIENFGKSLDLGNGRVEEVYKLRGTCYKNLGKTEEAFSDISNAIEFSTDKAKKASHYFIRGQLLKEKETGRCLQDLSKAFELYDLETDRVECCKQRIVIFEIFKNRREWLHPLDVKENAKNEIKDLNFILKRKPLISDDNDLKIMMKRRIELHKSQEEYDQAIRFIQELLSSDHPKFTREEKMKYRIKEVGIFEKLKNHDKCVQLWSNLIKISKDEEERAFYFVQRASYYERVGQDEKSLKDFGVSLFIFENSNVIPTSEDDEKPTRRIKYTALGQDFRQRRGELYLKLRKYEDAIADYTFYYDQGDDYLTKEERLDLEEILYNFAQSIYETKSTKKDDDDDADDEENEGEDDEEFEQEFIEKKKYEFTISVFTKLINRIKTTEKSDFVMDCYEYRGDCHHNLDNLELSLHDFSKSIEYSLSDERAHFSFYKRCKINYKLRNYQDSIRDGIEYLKIFDYPYLEKLSKLDHIESMISYLIRNYVKLEDINRVFFYTLFTNYEKDQKKILKPPREYRTSKMIEGGYFGLDKSKKEEKQQQQQQEEEEEEGEEEEKEDYEYDDDAAFVRAHIAGYKFKDRKLMFHVILNNLIREKDVKRSHRMLRKEFSLNFENDYDQRLDFLIHQTDLLTSSSYEDNLYTLQWENGKSYKIMKYLLLSSNFGSCSVDNIPKYEDPLETKNLNHNIITIPSNIPFIEQKRLISVLMGLCRFCPYIGPTNEENEDTTPSDCYFSEDVFIKEMITLHQLFFAMKMEDHMFVLCQFVYRLSLKNTLRLFCRMITYENVNDFVIPILPKKRSEDCCMSDVFDRLISEDDKDSIDEENSSQDDMPIYGSFKFPLSYCLFVHLKSYFDEIEKSKNYVSVLDQLGYYMKLKYETLKDIVSKGSSSNKHSFDMFKMNVLSHTFFVSKMGLKNGNMNDFKTIFDEKVGKKLIHNPKLYSNITLITSEHHSKEDEIHEYVIHLPSHKEILLLRSNFFYEMFKFPGEESESNVVKIERTHLSSTSLDFLVAKMYSFGEDYESIEKRLEKYSFKYLFELLVHSEMYNEYTLQCCVVQVIYRKFEEEREDGKLLQRILKIGYHFENVPERIRFLFVKGWMDSKFVSERKEIESILDQSIKYNKMKKKLREQELKILDLSEEMDDDEMPTLEYVKKKE